MNSNARVFGNKSISSSIGILYGTNEFVISKNKILTSEEIEDYAQYDL